MNRENWWNGNLFCNISKKLAKSKHFFVFHSWKFPIIYLFCFKKRGRKRKRSFEELKSIIKIEMNEIFEYLIHIIFKEYPRDRILIWIPHLLLWRLRFYV